MENICSSLFNSHEVLSLRFGSTNNYMDLLISMSTWAACKRLRRLSSDSVFLSLRRFSCIQKYSYNIFKNLPDWITVAHSKLDATPRNSFLARKTMGLRIQWNVAAFVPYQDGHGRRLDRDVDRIEVCPFDVLHTLHVDIKYTDEVSGLDVLHGSSARPVHVARKHRALNEIPVVDPRLHDFPWNVMIIWNPKNETYNNTCVMLPSIGLILKKCVGVATGVILYLCRSLRQVVDFLLCLKDDKTCSS